MKLLRYGPPGQEKPGLLDREGKIRDLSGVVRDIDGEALAPASLDRLRRLDPGTLPLVTGAPRLGPCVAHVSKLVAIGLNYRAHAAETGAAIPKEPIFFMKATPPPLQVCVRPASRSRNSPVTNPSFKTHFPRSSPRSSASKMWARPSAISLEAFTRRPSTWPRSKTG